MLKKEETFSCFFSYNEQVLPKVLFISFSYTSILKSYIYVYIKRCTIGRSNEKGIFTEFSGSYRKES